MSIEKQAVQPQQAKKTSKRKLIAIVGILLAAFLGPRFIWLVSVTSTIVVPKVNEEFGDFAAIGPGRDLKIRRIWHGLPHQLWDGGGLIQVLFTTRNWQYEGFRFRSEESKLSVEQERVLVKILSDPSSYQPYTGPKLCGGFHPDACIEVESRGETLRLLLCYGCDECLIFGPQSALHVEINESAVEKLESALPPYNW